MTIKKKGRLFCLLVMMSALLVIAAGCNSDDLSWKTFEGSAVEQSFPVPKEASKMETAPSNAKMDYVRYSLPGLEASSMPALYEKEIRAWGWTEKKDEKTASTRVYLKNKQVVQVSLQKNAMIITIPKEDNKVVIHGLESKP